MFCFSNSPHQSVDQLKKYSCVLLRRVYLKGRNSVCLYARKQSLMFVRGKWTREHNKYIKKLGYIQVYNKLGYIQVQTN